jgi:hypothetical protein
MNYDNQNSKKIQMKKIALVFIICFYPVFTFSQNKWIVGFSVQPGTSSLYVHDEIFDINYTSERYKKGEFSYILSTKIKFHLKERFIFSAGINYSRLSYHLLDEKKYYTEAGLISRSAIDKNTDTWQSWTYIPHYHFIGIPVSVGTRVFEFGNFNIYLLAGASANYAFYENSTNIDLTDRGTKKYLELGTLFNSKMDNPLIFNLEFGMALAFKINKKTTFNLSPMFQFSLSEFKTDFIQHGKLLNFGVEAGVDFVL